MAAVIVAQEAEPFAQRGRLLVPHRGIKCVNPSKATESPSLTNSATASRNLPTSVTPKPNAHRRRIPFRVPASGKVKPLDFASSHDPTSCSRRVPRLRQSFLPLL